MIVSIFKQGNKNDTNSYRGISLLSNLSKIFTGILNKRIVSFTEDRKLIGENQGVSEKEGVQWKSYSS